MWQTNYIIFTINYYNSYLFIKLAKLKLAKLNLEMSFFDLFTILWYINKEHLFLITRRRFYLNFRELKRNSKKSLKKNYIITVLITITGLIFLSLYSITSSTISNGIESFSNLFEYGIFLPNTGYEIYKEYKQKQEIEKDDLLEITEIEQQKTLAEKYRVTDGLFKPLLDFLDNEWQFLYDNIAKIARNIIPRQRHN